MPSVAFHSGFAGYFTPNRFDNTNDSYGFFSSGQVRYIYILSIDPNITTRNTRSSFEALGGQLIAWKENAVVSHTRVNNTLLQFSTTIVAATASGVATHFVVLGSVSSSNLSTAWMFKGTVGQPGSGADMEIGNTNIVAGEDYSLGSWSYNIYKGFTY